MPHHHTIVGTIGLILLVIGSAWPIEKTLVPILSRKNLFFALGNICMFGYSILNYYEGGSIFFVLLQILIMISTVLMLLGTNDTFDATVIACVGAGLAVYSLFLFRDFSTIIFVLGLVILGIGFAMQMGSYWRHVALTVGSILIALFSLLEGDQIFLWLNVIFAAFSGWHARQLKPAVNHRKEPKS